MHKDRIPNHWQRIQIDPDDIEIPASKSPVGEIVEPTHAREAFENPDGIQIIQKQCRTQTEKRAERGGAPMIEPWIDILDVGSEDEELLFTTAFLEPERMDELTQEYMTLIDGVRESN